MKGAVWFLAAALATPAVAGPCDSLSDPMAFNACLASHGPTARAVHLGAAPPSALRAGGRIVVARPHGRSELVFSPGR